MLTLVRRRFVLIPLEFHGRTPPERFGKVIVARVGKGVKTVTGTVSQPVTEPPSHPLHPAAFPSPPGSPVHGACRAAVSARRRRRVHGRASHHLSSVHGASRC